MILSQTIDDRIVGAIRFPEGVALTSKTYCELLESVLLPRLGDLPLSSRCKVITMHDNSPIPPPKATTSFLASLGIKSGPLMTD